MRRRFVRIGAATTAATIILAGSAILGNRSDADKGQGESAFVVRVVDGDTIRVRFADGRTEKVRYIGIDTWETGDQPHGGHGTEANRAMVEGKQVRLIKDVSERDNFGRLLRYVYVGDTSVNASLVREGHARAKDYPPDSTHAAEFATLQRRAQAASAGCFTPAPAAASDTGRASSTPGSLIGNRNSHKLHNLQHSACQNYVSATAERNKVPFASAADAMAQGFRACPKC